MECSILLLSSIERSSPYIPKLSFASELKKESITFELFKRIRKLTMTLLINELSRGRL